MHSSPSTTLGSLDELKLPYPKDQSISPLVKEVQKHLNLSPAHKDIEPYLKQILGGLQNVASGIGALRTHSGDAHGRGKGVSSPDSSPDNS
ncbi:abortive infection family protein [Acidobacteria bacterium AH-259-G07]|nr:abortive infection family protein [Acidobacteria bacterium AH-259-G07]